MSQNKSESSNSPKPSEEAKTSRGFSMSLQSSKTKTFGSKNFIKKRRIADDQEEEIEQSTVEYITVFEDKKSKRFNLKKKQGQSSKQDTTNKKDNKEELDAPEYLTNNSGLSFGLNITKKSTKDPKEKRESILAKIKEYKDNQNNEQLIDNEGTKILLNEKVEPEKSLKEQALEELLREPKKEETVDEDKVDRKSSFKLLDDVDMIKGKDKTRSWKRSRSPSSEL